MFSRTFDGCLFDMDGTLVDSSALVESTWKAFSSKYSLNFEEVINYAHGRPTEHTVRKFLGDTTEARMETERIVALEETTTDGIKACPGAHEIVEQMKRYRWGVVTSATRDLAQNRLAAANLPIPATLVTADDVKAGKPDPEGFLIGARVLGLEPERTLVFEDSLAGLRAAIAGGFPTVRLGLAEHVPGEAGSLASFEDISVVNKVCSGVSGCFGLSARTMESRDEKA